MDRIFGFNQKIFTKKNIIALCRNNKGIPTKFYPNKNDFINTLMDTYNISDKKKQSKMILQTACDVWNNAYPEKKITISDIKTIIKSDRKIIAINITPLAPPTGACGR